MGSGQRHKAPLWDTFAPQLPRFVPGRSRKPCYKTQVANIWSVYNRESRLVLGLSDEPGIFNFAIPPADEVEPFECSFATFQCYDVSIEAQMLSLVDQAEDLESFFDSLLSAGFNVVPGQPQPGKFARL